MLTLRLQIVAGILLLSLGISATAASADDASEMAALRANLIAFFVEHPESEEVLQPHLDLLRPDGTWANID